ncbi:hypothetical protein RKK42_01425 [Klebsiella pneumoniae]|nr:hypothetical protein [Klebsiella pneumoniae]
MKPGKEGHLIGGLSFFMDSINHFTALPRQRLANIYPGSSAVGADKRLPLRLYSGGEKTAKAVR